MDVPDLSIALGATASIYEFEALLNVNSSSVAGLKLGIQFSNGGGAGTTSMFIGMTTASVMAMAAQTVVGTLCATVFGTVTQNVLVLIKGMIVTGTTTGNITVQQAKVTSGTAKVIKDSVFKVRLVGAF